jgi:AraC-like DNA-binding protein
MGIYRRIPAPPLDRYVAWLWHYDDFFPDHDREHVLPDGSFELIINLQEEPRKLFDREDSRRFDTFKRGWISGAHEDFLVIDALQNSTMMGVHFKPGGAASVLGLPASEVTSQVVELDAIWGSDAWLWRERLMACPTPAQKCALMERWLAQKLARNDRIGHDRTGLDWAVRRFIAEPHIRGIGSVAAELGISHKHFIQRFRDEVGLTPKLFCRIQRFQEVLGQIQKSAKIEWADLAYSCGYYDQAHFVNDFMAFSGVNPTTYLVQRLEGEINFIRAVDQD